MVLSSVVNELLGLVAVVTFYFCSGSSSASFDRLLDPLSSPHAEFPFIDIYISATGSRGGTTAMACAVLLVIFMSSMAVVTAASRQI
jgi:hypothetical protein